MRTALAIRARQGAAAVVRRVLFLNSLNSLNSSNSSNSSLC